MAENESTTVTPYISLEEAEPMWRRVAARSTEQMVLLQPFSPEEFAARWAAVRLEMRKQQLGVLVLTVPEAIYYLTNYQTPGNAYTVLVVPLDEANDPCVFVRELERAFE